jgi:hypothetical protein
MPFNVVRDTSRCPVGKPWAVIGGRSGNDLFGCHPSKEHARTQQQALYAQDADAADPPPAAPDPAPAVAYITPASVAW